MVDTEASTEGQGCLSLKFVPRSMAVDAQGDEVLCRVVSQPAAEFPVVDLQVSERPTQLTTPAVSRQNLFAESSVVVGVEPPARLPLAQYGHSGSSGSSIDWLEADFATINPRALCLGKPSPDRSPPAALRPGNQHRSSPGNIHVICPFPTSGQPSRELFQRPTTGSCKP